MARDLVVALPIAMDTLVGMCIDNMLNFVATLSGSRPRYGALSVGSLTIPSVAIPNGVDVLVDVMRSNAMYNTVSRIWGSVDGFCSRIVGSMIQDWVRNAVSAEHLENFLESIRSVEVSYTRNGDAFTLLIRWGSRGRWIGPNMVPFQLRSAELLEGARIPYPKTLVIEEKRRGKKKEERIDSGGRVQIEIDSYVYAFIVAALAVSTLSIDIDRRGRVVREYRCVCYRLTGYDASKILQILVDRYRTGEVVFPSYLLAPSSARVFSKDVPEILVVHYVLAKLSSYVSRFYNARLDLAFYHVTPGRRADVDLSTSIHFVEYRNLLDLLVENRSLANDYATAIETIVNLLTSDEEERKRAGSLGLELVNYIDRLARDIYALEDLYNVLRIVEQIKRSDTLYRYLGNVSKIFERLVDEFLYIRSRKLVG